MLTTTIDALFLNLLKTTQIQAVKGSLFKDLIIDIGLHCRLASCMVQLQKLGRVQTQIVTEIAKGCIYLLTLLSITVLADRVNVIYWNRQRTVINIP